jgi:hypothetical protein
LRGVEAQYEGVEDVQPLWTSAKSVPVEDRGSSALESTYNHAVDAAKTMEEAEDDDADIVDHGVVPAILTEAPEANVADSDTTESA